MPELSDFIYYPMRLEEKILVDGLNRYDQTGFEAALLVSAAPPGCDPFLFSVHFDFETPSVCYTVRCYGDVPNFEKQPRCVLDHFYPSFFLLFESMLDRGILKVCGLSAHQEMRVRSVLKVKIEAPSQMNDVLLPSLVHTPIEVDPEADDESWKEEILKLFEGIVPDED